MSSVAYRYWSGALLVGVIVAGLIGYYAGLEQAKVTPISTTTTITVTTKILATTLMPQPPWLTPDLYEEIFGELSAWMARWKLDFELAAETRFVLVRDFERLILKDPAYSRKEWKGAILLLLGTTILDARMGGKNSVTIVDMYLTWYHRIVPVLEDKPPEDDPPYSQPSYPPITPRPTPAIMRVQNFDAILRIYPTDLAEALHELAVPYVSG